MLLSFKKFEMGETCWKLSSSLLINTWISKYLLEKICLICLWYKLKEQKNLYRSRVRKKGKN